METRGSLNEKENKKKTYNDVDKFERKKKTTVILKGMSP